MGIFAVNAVARNIRNESQATRPIDVVVDTGSEFTWLPASTLEEAAIERRRERLFETATGDVVARSTGYAILEVEEFVTVDEVVFAEPGDQRLLGARTLEGFGVVVDPIAHRLVARATLVA